MTETARNAGAENPDPVPAKVPASSFSGIRLGILFLALAMLLLTPALLNGFPFVMDDSIAYSGQGVNWIRSKTAAVAAAPLYRWIGYWGLPLLNTLFAAGAWVLLCRSFDVGRWAWLALPLCVLSLQPVYASAVIVDIWFFAAVAFLIVAFRWSSPFLALLSGILLSAHGSGPLLVVPFGLAAALLFRRPAYLLTLALALGTTVIVNAALDSKYYPEIPRLGKTFVASRLFSIHPELLTRECERSKAAVLCEARSVVEQVRALPENAGRRDFFWDVTRALSPRFDLVAFEEQHATPIIRDGLTWKLSETARFVTEDLISLYTLGTWFDFTDKLLEPMPEGYYRSLQYRQDILHRPSLEATATGLRFALYIIVAAILLARWRQIDPAAARWIVLILLLCLGNDILFALLSGPPDRYHHRILPLLAATVTIAFAARNGTPRPR